MFRFAFCMAVIGCFYYLAKKKRISLRSAICNWRVFGITLAIYILLFLFEVGIPIWLQESTHTYPDRAFSGFISGCFKSQKMKEWNSEIAGKSCSCYAKEIQKKYTYGEFKGFIVEMSKNEMPPGVKDVITLCSKKEVK